MKRFVNALAAAGLASVLATPALAQSTPPPAAPPLSATQSADVDRQLSLYRTEIDGRVGRGEIRADEGNRLLQWRRWQLAQQAAGLAPPPASYAQAPVVREEAYVPYYVPYYAGPYYRPAPYYAPGPYWYGPSICAGGWGRHGGGRICL